MSASLVAATVYFGVVLASPLVRPELLIVAMFIAGTHSKAPGGPVVGYALLLCAVTISVLSSRTNPEHIATGDHSHRESGPLLLSGLLLVAWLSISHLQRPLDTFADEKLAAVILGTAMPAFVISQAARRGRIDLGPVAHYTFLFGCVVGAAALVSTYALGLGDSGVRLRLGDTHPLALAQICSMALLFGIMRASDFRLRRWQARAGRALLAGCLVLTASKGPILVLVLALAVHRPTRKRATMLMARRSILIKRVVIVSCCAAACALFVPRAALDQAIPERLRPSYYTSPDAESRTQSISGREQLWSEAFEKWSDNPIVGLGIGASGDLETTSTFSGEQLAIYPHNILLETALETGLVGVSLLLLLGAAFLSDIRSLPDAKAVLVWVSVSAMFTGSLADHRGVLLLAATLVPAAAVAGADRRAVDGSLPPEPARKPAALSPEAFC